VHVGKRGRIHIDGHADVAAVVFFPAATS